MTVPTDDKKINEILEMIDELKIHMDYLEQKLIEIERLNFIRTDFTEFYESRHIKSSKEEPEIKCWVPEITVPCDEICDKSNDFDEKNNCDVSCSNGLPLEIPKLTKNKIIKNCQIIYSD